MSAIVERFIPLVYLAKWRAKNLPVGVQLSYCMDVLLEILNISKET